MHVFSNFLIPLNIYKLNYRRRLTGTFVIKQAVMVKQFNVPKDCNINIMNVRSFMGYVPRNKNNQNIAKVSYLSKLFFTTVENSISNPTLNPWFVVLGGHNDI